MNGLKKTKREITRKLSSTPSKAIKTNGKAVITALHTEKQTTFHTTTELATLLNQKKEIY